jgi:thioredoxin family protein
MYKLVILISIVFFGAGLMKKEKTTTEDFPISTLNIQPKELGTVHWLRDIKEATNLSEKEKKPILLLFQEVPGCATCRNYGHDVLSHPLIVETIETYFVPLAIYNNKEGKDREVLTYFKEPAWNNPVVRIINSKRKDLTKRISGNYSALGIVDAMREAMKAQNITIPEYLKILRNELSATQNKTQTAYLSMYCFWTGEKKLAEIDGVVETQAGFMDGREVVKVDFAPAIISYDILLQKAKTKSCTSHVYSDDLTQQLTAEKIVGSEYVSEKSSFKLDKETKYYLFKSSYKYVPMTKLQSVKANSLIGKGESPNVILSPRQLKLLDYIQNHPTKKWQSAINDDLISAWGRAEAMKELE